MHLGVQNLGKRSGLDDLHELTGAVGLPHASRSVPSATGNKVTITSYLSQ